MKQHEIRQQIKQHYPAMNKYDMNAIVQKVERGVSMGAILTIAYIQAKVSAHVRHNKTSYDSLFVGHYYNGSRTDARALVSRDTERIINQWKGIPR